MLLIDEAAADSDQQQGLSHLVEVGKIVRPVPERGRARDRARELVQCPSARPVLVRVLCSTFEGV